MSNPKPAYAETIIERVPFIDHMRGFIFLLMAFDHALHAYAANFARYAFYRDYDRSYVFDAFYLFNQSAIMPILFFTFGAYILPKLSALDYKGFWKDRFIKHGVTFIIGIPLFVPLLSYPKFHEYSDPNPTYFDYWKDLFFTEKLQAGPYWVMYAILIYTTVFLLINKLIPKCIPWIAKYIKKAVTSPTKVFSVFILFAMVVYGLSDLRWGAPWWIGFRNIFPDFLHGELFSLQASKFIMNFVYLVLGAAFMYSQAWKDTKTWKHFENKRFIFLALTILLGIAYVLYAHFYYGDGAFDYSIYRVLRLGSGSAEAWGEAVDLFPKVAPAILVRTSLLGALSFFQVITAILFFSAHSKKAKTKCYAFWASAAACCWGIFIFHDPIVIWGQFFLTDYNLPILLKFIIVFLLSISISWVVTRYLLKINYVKRVFEFD